MTDSPVGRFYEAVQYAIRHEYPTLDLSVLDGLDLLDRLAELCEDHKVCLTCGEPFCGECDLNYPVTGCIGDHCRDCWPECVPCRREITKDEAQQAALDAARGK